jgi:hypothetical protein
MSRYNRVSRIVATRCTIETPDGPFCDADGAPDMPFPICAQHAIELYRRMHEMVTAVQGKHREYPQLHDAVVQAVKDEADATPYVVYYVRVGDRIKIGRTMQLRQRLANYPPGSELLAVESGKSNLEARRISQFHHLLADRKEWFHPGADLLAHIARLQDRAA